MISSGCEFVKSLDEKTLVPGKILFISDLWSRINSLGLQSVNEEILALKNQVKDKISIEDPVLREFINNIHENKLHSMMNFYHNDFRILDNYLGEKTYTSFDAISKDWNDILVGFNVMPFFTNIASDREIEKWLQYFLSRNYFYQGYLVGGRPDNTYASLIALKEDWNQFGDHGNGFYSIRAWYGNLLREDGFMQLQSILFKKITRDPNINRDDVLRKLLLIREQRITHILLKEWCKRLGIPLD